MSERIPFRRSLGLSFLCLVIGCGSNPDSGPELVDAAGTVTLAGSPLAHADLTFIPVTGTPGIGGTARSDETGNFTVNYGRGGVGLPAGDYQVTVSQRLMPDGSPVAADDTTEAMDSPAQEKLPAKYSSPERTKLQAVVQSGLALQIDLEK